MDIAHSVKVLVGDKMFDRNRVPGNSIMNSQNKRKRDQTVDMNQRLNQLLVWLAMKEKAMVKSHTIFHQLAQSSG